MSPNEVMDELIASTERHAEDLGRREGELIKELKSTQKLIKEIERHHARLIRDRDRGVQSLPLEPPTDEHSVDESAPPDEAGNGELMTKEDIEADNAEVDRVFGPILDAEPGPAPPQPRSRRRRPEPAEETAS